MVVEKLYAAKAYDELFELYLQGINYFMSRRFNPFLTKLLKFVDRENALLIVFSDHGEDLEGLYPNDKGGKQLGHPEEFGHGCLLYDQTQKVVLIIKDENLPKNKNIEQQVRLVDLFPTILDLLKIKNNHKIDGISLVPIIKDNINLELPAYSETFYPEEQTQATGKFKNARNKISLRFANKYKYIFHLNSYRIEMYDLEKDKNEKDNLCKSF